MTMSLRNNCLGSPNRNSGGAATLVRHAEPTNIVFHQSLLAAEVTMKINRRHNMNTTLTTATGRLRAIGRLSRLVCLPVIALLVALPSSFGQTASPSPGGQTQINTTATEPAEAEPRLSAEELDSLVGPIALYPDSLLIQVLAASTYPLEVVQVKQWMDKNRNLKDKALIEAVGQQGWDPSVQGLAAFPAIVEKLANNVQWTTDLGNAFLAQESDVMDAVQRLRTRAQENGTLKTNDKQKVSAETTSEGKQAITIEPAQREVVYVPTYNTQYVYRDSGSSGYSRYSDDSDYSGSSGSDSGYSYAAYAVGAATGYYWGHYNWRDRYGEINYKNYYNNNRYNYGSNNKVNNSGNYNSNNKVNNSGNNNWNNKVNNSGNNNWSNQLNKLNGSDKGTGRWQHDPSHRGNAPYSNRDLSNRFGQGNNRLSQGTGTRASQGPGTNAANQLARGNRPSQLARANPGNQLGRGNLSRLAGSGGSASTRLANGGLPNRVGNRVPSNWPSTARGGAFGPANGDFARAFSGRGAQSMGPQGAFRGGPPAGLRAGGPPMGGGFRGGLPGGGFPGGGPPMGGLPAGGPPLGGAPPPPPPPMP
jgi:Protein of unknown function (DUF3300)